MAPARGLLVLGLAAGCASPGEIVTADGAEPLRTALYVELDLLGAPAVAALLSNSEVPCGVDSDDPAEEEINLLKLHAAFYREGARNALLLLHADERPARWTGSYTAEPDARGRSFQGWFVSVQEAALEEADGLSRTYSLVEYTAEGPADGAGVVAIDGDDGDALTGSFDFEDPAISGTFEATSCGASAETEALFDLLLNAYIPELFADSGSEELSSIED